MVCQLFSHWLLSRGEEHSMDILFVSLGCDKNLADTEMMLGILQKRGFGFTDDEEKADA